MKDDAGFARLCVLCLTALIGLVVAGDVVLLLAELPPAASLTTLGGILVGALIALAGPRTGLNGNSKPPPPPPQQ